VPKRSSPGEGSAARLKRYRAKRDFERTREPAGGGKRARAASAKGASRYVIHEHHARRLHWDLRLERDGVLVSWAIPNGLPETPNDNRFAAATEEHPLEYLDFEGEIPKGEYGAGKISVWDRGTYECLKWEPRKVEVALHGERLDARYALFAIGPRSIGEAPRGARAARAGAGERGETGARGGTGDWMIHRMDPPEDPGREPMPEQIAPMLARGGEVPRESEGWAYEIKWDGVRAIAYCQPGRLRVQSRNLLDITARYPELGALKTALSSHSAILDGELVVLGADGRPDFQALQRRAHADTPAQAKRLQTRATATYEIFDLLWLDGHSLMELPYRERRKRLDALKLEGRGLQVPAYFTGDGHAVLEASTEQGLEGIVAKGLDSTYQPGQRTSAWVKVKNHRTQEVVIGGWTPGSGRRSDRVGALLMGVYEADGALRYCGRVGSGFSEAELDRLGRELAKRARESSPFAPGETAPPRGSHFCEPELVAEVRFTEWTRSGNLRHPVYKGLREDSSPREVVREDAPARNTPGPAPSGRPGFVVRRQSAERTVVEVDGRELALSNLSKVLYPQSGFTKGDVVSYYAAVAAVMVAHLKDRPLTVTRWPDGVEGKSFFQKQAPAHKPQWVRTASIGRREQLDYVLGDDLPTLVWLANLAALELHVPMARASAIAQPTALVFDLDPGAPAGILECCSIALALQGTFENLGLESFAKTSGSKGLQVYLPLNRPGVGYEHTKTFARAVAQLLERAEPELVVSRMTKARRTGRVFIDWSQNDERKTTICAYSLRAVARPTVSTPLEWEEVRAARERGDGSALSFEPHEVLARVAEHGDLMAPVLSLVQELPAL
jgi:bifunctional non-homologous end joining protein LigD